MQSAWRFPPRRPPNVGNRGFDGYEHARPRSRVVPISTVHGDVLEVRKAFLKSRYVVLGKRIVRVAASFSKIVFLEKLIDSPSLSI
jgi:hypothetical protein